MRIETLKNSVDVDTLLEIYWPETVDNDILDYVIYFGEDDGSVHCNMCYQKAPTARAIEHEESCDVLKTLKALGVK